MLVLPLAANEPIGNLPLGTVNTAAVAVAEAVAAKMQAVCMPVFSYGFAVPFKAFGGACGLHATTLESALCGIAADASMWGAKFIAVIDATSFSSDMLLASVKRINGLIHGKIKAASVSWTIDKSLRKIISRSSSIDEPLRIEAAITAIASTIIPDLTNENDPLKQSPEKALIKSWNKRGRDPEQFRKFFADSRTGTVPAIADKDLGIKLIEAISDGCIAQIKISAKKAGIEL